MKRCEPPAGKGLADAPVRRDRAETDAEVVDVSRGGDVAPEHFCAVAEPITVGIPRVQELSRVVGRREARPEGAAHVACPGRGEGAESVTGPQRLLDGVGEAVVVGVVGAIARIEDQPHSTRVRQGIRIQGRRSRRRWDGPLCRGRAVGSQLKRQWTGGSRKCPAHDVGAARGRGCGPGDPAGVADATPLDVRTDDAEVLPQHPHLGYVCTEVVVWQVAHIRHENGLSVVVGGRRVGDVDHDVAGERDCNRARQPTAVPLQGPCLLTHGVWTAVQHQPNPGTAARRKRDDLRTGSALAAPGEQLIGRVGALDEQVGHNVACGGAGAHSLCCGRISRGDRVVAVWRVQGDVDRYRAPSRCRKVDPRHRRRPEAVDDGLGRERVRRASAGEQQAQHRREGERALQGAHSRSSGCRAM